MKPLLHHCPEIPAKRYAAWFDLRAADAPPRLPGYHLWYDEDGMRLFHGESDSFALRHRNVVARTGQSLLLARACAASRRPKVADLMAGWGTDGLALAMRGCEVIFVERQPIVWAMLDDFLTRLGLPATAVCTTAEHWCRINPGAVDIAYLDPMFPVRRKTALPGKPMQILRDLTGQNAMRAGQAPSALAEMIDLARAAARNRIVVKRRAKDPPAAAPNWCLRGRRVRFDIYRAPA